MTDYKFSWTVALTVFMAGAAVAPRTHGQPKETAAKAVGCLSCHRGIEPIMPSDSKMMQEIKEMAEEGDPEGCCVCHGGNPTASTKEAAHAGSAFYPDPSSPWVNENTCGMCHDEHVRVQWSSLMMSEAGKIQGTLWSFGALTGYEHVYGNYDFTNPDDPAERLGTETYRRYMERLAKIEPQVFVQKHKALPDAPSLDDLKQLQQKPELAAFTYLRNQCLRCHHAVKGRQVRGDFRGMGCSSCHIPYSNEGLYEGGDPSIPKDEPGHCLVHTIQATRGIKVTVHEVQYSGIPVETCTTCHNRGKRIGTSYQGLMESPYHSPYTEDGTGQPALHTKHYVAMQQDVHYREGMLCQDCHTSNDVHGDGFIRAANLASVEIECSDCHGTPEAYPWELPLGYMDEFDQKPAVGPPRGTARQLPDYLQYGTVYDPQDGYLLSARGNPLPNVVRVGNEVVVHTAGGKDLKLKPLKLLAQTNQLEPDAPVAMCAVRDHIDRMECYTCHTAWYPQCYGCHVKVDYSGDRGSFDWLAAGHQHAQDAHAADRGETGYETRIPGQIEEQRSYTRWEDPPLGVNGEGRISPVAPGCQPSFTVIGPDGQPVLLNHIFRTPSGMEGGGEHGQLCIDMSPVTPHTVTKHARSCESCHTSVKALGYGIGGGRLTRAANKALRVDLETADKQLLPKNARTQFAAIQNLSADWSRFVTEDGQQLQTVGHHFKGSRPLNQRERQRLDRRGVCLACHQEIPDQSLAVNLLHHVAEVSGQMPVTAQQHNSLLHKLLLTAAWVQAAAPAVALLVVVALAVRFVRRRRRKQQASKTSSAE